MFSECSVSCFILYNDWIFSLCFCRTDSLTKCQPSDFGLKDQTLTASNHKTIKQTQSISQWNHHHQIHRYTCDTDTCLFSSCCHHGCSVCSSRFSEIWSSLFGHRKVYCSHRRQCFVHTNTSESCVSLCFSSEDQMSRHWLSGTIIKLWISFMVITAAPALQQPRNVH